MLKLDELLISRNEIPDPKKLIIKSTTYNKKIPPVAAKRPNLKFSSGLIILERYANKRENSMNTVKEIDCKTIPS